MQLGPFDRRKARWRCQPCSASHLKCSGEQPCTSCTRRRIVCSCPRPRERAGGPVEFILVESAVLGPRQKKSKPRPGHDQARWQHQGSAPAPQCRLADEQLRHVYFFDVFVRRNSFTGKTATCGDEVKKLAGLHSQQAAPLHHAILALGAMYAVQIKAPDGPSSRGGGLLSALQHYSQAVSELRHALQVDVPATDARQEGPWASILWTMQFLGLFELMNDATGHSWRQHIVHGSSKALQASGPLSCRAGPGRAFFSQVRVLEVCRTILYNESSFLAQPQWLRLSRELWNRDREPGTVDKEGWRPLDSLLDIIVMCSELRVRAAAFIAGQEAAPDSEPSPEAREISTDGHRLREALRCWHAAYVGSEAEASDCDASMVLARVFFAATSIYLSGVFDYEASHWQRLELETATLNRGVIQHHVRAIVELAGEALSSTCLSPLLLLFPLRVAGARSRQQWQRRRVAELLGRIAGGGFVVASTVDADLGEVWEGHEAAAAGR